jgi:nucleotide-binding universal stress UspA family protein
MNTTLDQSKAATTTQVPSPATTARVLREHRASTDAAGLKIKTILVPLDFSRASMEALSYAVSLATKFAAVIHLVHVSAPDEASEVPEAGHLMRQTAESLAFAREKLAETHEKHVPPFWPANSHVRTGQPYHEICQQAREIDADLIVLATRGHTGLKRILLGSTAERVVRFTPCPVLVVRRRKRAELHVRKILVPTDFSQCAMAGAMYAALWARTFDAKLRLLHVVFPPAPVLLDSVSANLPAENITGVANARLSMEASRKLDFMEGVKCETEIRTGYAADEICGETDDVDLVVISTHGRTGLKHAFIGSVAEQVVRYAQCPVMVVPSRCAIS